MVQVSAAEILGRRRTVDVTSFTALVRRHLLMFEPTGAFGRDLADEDDELNWDIKRQDDNNVWQDVTRVRIARDAACRRDTRQVSVRHEVGWPHLVGAMLRHVAMLALDGDEWEAMAAQRLGVTAADLQG